MSRFTPSPILALLIALTLSISLAALANPGQSAPLLAWVYLTPLLYCLRWASPTQGKLFFCAAFASFGFAWWGVTVSWLIPAAVQFIEMQYWHAVVVYILCCLSLSLPYWLIGLGLYYCRQLNWLQQILAQAAIISLCLSLIDVAIPGNFAHSLYRYPHFIQITELGGQASLVFLMAITAASLAQLKQGRVTKVLLLALMPLILSYSYGHWRLNNKPEVLTQLRIASIQPNYSRESKLADVIEQSKNLIQAQDKKIDLLVWPELPTVFSYIENTRQRQQVKSLLEQIKLPLLLTSGYVYPSKDKLINGQQAYYNAANLIQADGKVSASYYKQKLVPFFEYLPYEQHYPQLRKIFPHSYNYLAGENQMPMNFNPQVKIAALLCYESLFANTLAQQVEQGANIFINPGNDGWFGSSFGSERHLALALFRSVENHIPWLRVTNSGVSIATTAFGEVITGSRTDLQVQASRINELKIYQHQTLYSRYPHGFTLLLVTLLIALFGQFYFQKKTLTR